MSIEAWIGIAALLLTAISTVAGVTATIVANRPREEALTIVNTVLNQTLSWGMTAATIVGGILFWKGYEGAGALFWVGNALVFSYFFLRAEGVPGRPAIFMLVVYWVMGSTMVLAGLISKITSNLSELIAALSKAA